MEIGGAVGNNKFMINDEAIKGCASKLKILVEVYNFLTFIFVFIYIYICILFPLYSFHNHGL